MYRVVRPGDEFGLRPLFGATCRRHAFGPRRQEDDRRPEGASEPAAARDGHRASVRLFRARAGRSAALHEESRHHVDARGAIRSYTSGRHVTLTATHFCFLAILFIHNGNTFCSVLSF